MRLFARLAAICVAFAPAMALAQSAQPMRGGLPTWSGPYFGLQVGVASTSFGYGVSHPLFSTSGDRSSTDFNFGAHAGVNGQIGMFVFGGEADIERLDGSRAFSATLAGVNFAGSADAPWIGTLRARAGFSFDRFLVYGTGGIAATRATFKASATNLFTNEVSNYFVGLALGAGVEYALTNNITARVEYRHVSFADNTFSFTGADASKLDLSINSVRIGASLKF